MVHSTFSQRFLFLIPYPKVSMHFESQVRPLLFMIKFVQESSYSNYFILFLFFCLRITFVFWLLSTEVTYVYFISLIYLHLIFAIFQFEIRIDFNELEIWIWILQVTEGKKNSIFQTVQNWKNQVQINSGVMFSVKAVLSVKKHFT